MGLLLLGLHVTYSPVHSSFLYFCEYRLVTAHLWHLSHRHPCFLLRPETLIGRLDFLVIGNLPVRSFLFLNLGRVLILRVRTGPTSVQIQHSVATSFTRGVLGTTLTLSMLHYLVVMVLLFPHKSCLAVI